LKEEIKKKDPDLGSGKQGGKKGKTTTTKTIIVKKIMSSTIPGLLAHSFSQNPKKGKEDIPAKIRTGGVCKQLKKRIKVCAGRVWGSLVIKGRGLDCETKKKKKTGDIV